jgi:trk system potassium uptake protein TrkA
MRVVILGCGRVGARLASMLDREGHDVRVIDVHSDAFRRLDSTFGGMTVLGQGIDEDVLRRAGADGADVFAAVTDDDNTNIMASQVVQWVFHTPKIITRIYDPAREETYRSLGLQTVCPTELSAQLISEMLVATDRPVPAAPAAGPAGR